MSSGKVKCTCGWSWNKSDSSKKDMYICHECGRDNSNNIPKAQEGIKSPNVQAQEQYFQEKNKEGKGYNKFIGNTGEELIDTVQRFIPGLRNLPGLGSTFAVGEAEAYNQTPSLSDELGMIPNTYTQLASLMLLEAETEKENMHKFSENKNRGVDLTKLIPEQEVNNKVIDNTYVPKPKIGKIKETKQQTKQEVKSKQIPYKEEKETNKVEIDNTRTVKPQVNNNYKPKSKPETKYKFNIPSITYSDKSFVMPREVNDTKIDNTYVAKPRRENGGWLDQYADGGTMQEHQENYNDYNISAPEGFEGDGYSNVGRNSSPAWGGQFQGGGKVPLYVESKNDPRYKAYRDSVSAYNTSIQDKNETLDFIKRQLIKDNNNRGILDKTFNDKLTAVKKDLDYNVQTYPGGIKPIKSYVYERSDGKTQLGAYDVLKKPQQQVIVKPTTTKKTTNSTDDFFSSGPPKRHININPILPIQNNLQSAGLVYPDNNIETDIDIHNRARIPKYYDVIDKVNQNFGGSESQYKYYPENGDLPDVAPSPYNTRTVTPHYQMGGNVYPVNYVPEAQTGGSFPGATGFSYARTGSIPSKGPRRNQTDKTDASAQNGKEMQHYQQGLDWKPKSISRDGSVIKDDMGYWNPDNWGKVVEIGSTDITMEGVDQPLLGISDTGDTKLMKPGKNYKFKGKKVTEYPMAKNGMRQEQKGLQNLDNLTNFTNYNTKQPGGWLDNL